MQISDIATSQRSNSSAILPRIAKGDCLAIEDCINTYCSLVCSLAEKLTNSPEDAATTTREIFLNIWRYAACFDSTIFDEITFITIIACEKLSEYDQLVNSKKLNNSLFFTNQRTSKGSHNGQLIQII